MIKRILHIILLPAVALSVYYFASRDIGAQTTYTPCASGGLTTSVNKVYQMIYPDETFLQLVNIDLLKNVSQLKDLTCLQYLDATDRTVQGDIVDLKNLTNLEVLSLYSNPDVYGNICSLSGAVKLRSLKFAFDPKITGDIACLKDLTKLETFAMTHTQISGNLSVFADMPNLKAIYINGTNVSGDICSLSNLTNLEELGISDEASNPNITGDLSCLDNLQKLRKVSIYNTGATNCGHFTQTHPNIPQGGCSEESRQTLENRNQQYEKKIGKDAQTALGERPDYQKSALKNDSPEEKFDNGQSSTTKGQSSPLKGGFFAKLVNWLKNLFSRFPFVNKKITAPPEFAPNTANTKTGDAKMEVNGPLGCRNKIECDAICSKPENREQCSKFTPPGN